jgi:hypothetical protein
MKSNDRQAAVREQLEMAGLSPSRRVRRMATHVANHGETRSGTFSWPGSVKQQLVPTGR